MAALETVLQLLVSTYIGQLLVAHLGMTSPPPAPTHLLSHICIFL